MPIPLTVKSAHSITSDDIGQYRAISFLPSGSGETSVPAMNPDELDRDYVTAVEVGGELSVSLGFLEEHTAYFDGYFDSSTQGLIRKYLASAQQYLEILPAEPVPTHFRLVLIPAELGLSYTSPPKHYDDPWEFTLLFSRGASKYASDSIVDVLNTSLHEYLHALFNYHDISLDPQVLEEAFISLAAMCMGYKTLDNIPDTHNAFWEDIFADVNQGYSDLLDKMTERSFEAAEDSIEGIALASFHFQALANNPDGLNVRSPLIPEFCNRAIATPRHPMHERPHPALIELLDKAQDR